MEQSFLPINKITKEPYALILGYPNPKKRQLESRLAELRRIGITAISFQGQTKLGRVCVLGKGYVGVVVLAKRRRKLVALKIRRLDSQREQMEKEANLLKFANKVGVGPKLIQSSKDFLIMEYLDGEKIGEWIKKIKGKGSTKKMKPVIKKVLEDCYSLDISGFDHGELSSLSKHVIIGKSKTTLIDFDSSSLERRASNVTSATQGIFIGSGIAKKVQRIYNVPSKNKIIRSLRIYKKEKTRKSFDNLLNTLKL